MQQPYYWLLALLTVTGGCYQGVHAFEADDGETLGGPAGDESTSGAEVPPPANVLPSEARRLSQSELRQVLLDVLDLELDAVANLPQDARTPFDNDYTTQSSSLALVQGMYELSLAAGEAVTDDPSIVERVVGCSVSAEPACLEAVAETLGRRLLRRPLSATEVGELVALRDAAGGDDEIAAGLIVSTLLLDPEFLYRIERGEEEDGLVALEGPAIASRMSFLVWGSAPDDALLARADDLRRAEVRADEVTRMLSDDRGVRQMQRLHAMWLNYDDMLPADPSLASALRQETDAVIERVLFEEGLPWTDLLLFDETYVTPELAAHYDFEPIAETQWVGYPDDGRGGILSHGSYLSTGVNFGITSPTQRGKNVLELLLCRELPAVPAEVMVDEPPGTDSPDACKEDIWSMAKLETCGGCHVPIDSIGFGLEQYGAMGEFRTTEEDRPQCEARGDGQLVELGEFSGPGELGRLLADSPEVSGCFTQMFLRFALGRADISDAVELVDRLSGRFIEDPDVSELVAAVVTDHAFAYRSIEQ